MSRCPEFLVPSPCFSSYLCSMLKTTPFHARTAPLVRAQTWRRWAGYQVASAYDPHPDREYAAVRNVLTPDQQKVFDKNREDMKAQMSKPKP